MKSIGRVAASAVFGVVTLTASVSPLPAEQSPRVSGTITYRERIVLASTAVLEVRLDDVTRAGAVPPVIAQRRIEQPGQVPIRFEMSYPARAIDPGGRYAVRATISDGGVVLFTSLDTALVLTQGHGARVDLMLTRVAGAIAPAPPAAVPPAPPLPPAPLQNLPATFAGTLPCADCAGTRYQLNLFPDDSFFLRRTFTGKSGEPVDDIGSWTISSDRRVLVLKGRSADEQMFALHTPGTLRPLDGSGQPIASPTPYELFRSGTFRPMTVRLPMRGIYASVANAGEFVECSTGQRWPVAAEAASKALETAYAGARSAPGAAVLAEIEGVVIARPMAGGSGTQQTLIVEKVARLLPRESCAPRFTGAQLPNTFWRLTHIGDRAVAATTDPRREPSMVFQAPVGTAEGAFSGSSGCHRLIGTYVVDNAAMTLTVGGAMGGTMTACKDNPAAEAAFVAALKATRTYRVAGRTLELMDEKGVRLARFEARPSAGITVR